MVFVGIDPGKSGAIAVIDGDGKSLGHSVFSWQEYDMIIKHTVSQDNCLAIVEQVHAMPKQGVSSCFTFGQNFGFIQGLLFANNCPFQEVSPVKWKKYFGLNKDKNASIMCATRLFPSLDLRATSKCRKAHDGIAEAYLLAEYGRRMECMKGLSNGI